MSTRGSGGRRVITFDDVKSKPKKKASTGTSCLRDLNSDNLEVVLKACKALNEIAATRTLIVDKDIVGRLNALSYAQDVELKREALALLETLKGSKPRVPSLKKKYSPHTDSPPKPKRKSNPRHQTEKIRTSTDSASNSSVGYMRVKKRSSKSRSKPSYNGYSNAMSSSDDIPDVDKNSRQKPAVKKRSPKPRSKQIHNGYSGAMSSSDDIPDVDKNSRQKPRKRMVSSRERGSPGKNGNVEQGETTTGGNVAPGGQRWLIEVNLMTLGTKLGSGAFGTVYEGRYRHTPVAVKVCTTRGKKELGEFIQEVQFMLQLRPHANVVQIYGFSVSENQLYMVLEYMVGGSLKAYIKKGPIAEPELVELFLGICRGMEFLHAFGVIHRDLAARNILLSKAMEPKVADFGLSRVTPGKYWYSKQTYGPIPWMAPESIGRNKYSPKSDAWTFGILMWECVSRESAIKGKDVLKLAIEIRDNGYTPTIPNTCSKFLCDIMKRCWEYDSSARPSFSQMCELFENQMRKRFSR